jgi:hypothetical protein
VSRAPGALSIATHGVEPIALGTRATLTIEYTGWLGGVLARLFRGITEEYLGLEAAGLKRRSEQPV